MQGFFICFWSPFDQLDHTGVHSLLSAPLLLPGPFLSQETETKEQSLVKVCTRVSGFQPLRAGGEGGSRCSLRSERTRTLSATVGGAAGHRPSSRPPTAAAALLSRALVFAPVAPPHCCSAVCHCYCTTETLWEKVTSANLGGGGKFTAA